MSGRARFPALQDWLDWQESLHPRTIDLGLERVCAVLDGMGLGRPAPCVLTIGGTNGKGSVCAYLEAMLQGAGLQSGCFTSPHLRHYRERIRVGGRCATDEQIVEAFARIDEARGGQSLTFFEWNTLAALAIFEAAGVDVAVLEVGLGGRLDAVNAIDADVAAVVSVGLDHCEWLGTTVDAIAREKAGIFRAGRPAVFGSRQMPAALAEVAQSRHARLLRLGVDFDFVERPDGWDYVGLGSRRGGLPLPALGGSAQLANAATALAVLQAAEPGVLVPDEAVRTGLTGARLAGRFQVVGERPEWVLDVAHNPDAARVLAVGLAARRRADRTIAVCGILADKDVEGIAVALAGSVDTWIAAALHGPRAQAPQALAARLQAVTGATATPAAGVAEACDQARGMAGPGDRIVVFGSFQTVGPALTWLGVPA